MSIVRLQPERWAAGGEAIARADDGRIVFVGGALPGETVDVELTEERRDWARGRVRLVVEPSPERIEPPCAARRAGCGGCGWMHLGPEVQHEAKVAVVRDALTRIGRRPDIDVGVGGGVEPTGYRTTMRVCGDAAGRAGLRAEHAHDIVVTDDCLVAHPVLRDALAELIVQPGLEVVVRYSVAERRLGLWWDGDLDAVSGYPDHAAVGRTALLHEVVAGQRLQVALGSFFQSGPAAAELLVAAVNRLVPELATATTIVDAYAGVGMFAACAAPEVPTVYAIETGRTAVVDAEANLHGRGRQVTVSRSEVGGWRAPPGTVVDAIVADPARSGLGKPGVAALARLGAPVLALVSCDPASLGRDVKLLAENGYELTTCELIDVFPQTTHVETVARFDRH